MKKERIFWGVFLILGAIYLLMANMGFMKKMEIGIWSMIWTILFVAMLIKSIARVKFYGIFFSLAFLGIIYAEPLHITAITPWPILAAALFLGIGFNMIFDKKDWKAHIHINNDGHNCVYDEDDENNSYSVTFGSGVKYIHSDDFKEAHISCTFGGVKIYLDNAVMKDAQAYLYLDNSFGGVEIYVPKEWQIVKKLDNAFGGCDEKGRPMPDGMHTLYLQGDNNFGGITIIYV